MDIARRPPLITQTSSLFIEISSRQSFTVVTRSYTRFHSSLSLKLISSVYANYDDGIITLSWTLKLSSHRPLPFLSPSEWKIVLVPAWLPPWFLTANQISTVSFFVVVLGSASYRYTIIVITPSLATVVFRVIIEATFRSIYEPFTLVMFFSCACRSRTVPLLPCSRAHFHE